MKKKTIYFCIFLLVALVLSFYGAFTFIPSSARCVQKEARIQADMGQMRAFSEIYYSEKNSYENFDCDSSEQTRILCKDIVAQGGILPIFQPAGSEYCGYTQIKKNQQYICVSSKGGKAPQAIAIATYINPAGENLCDGKTFNCPDKAGMPTFSPLSLKEKFFTELPEYLFIIFIVLSLVEVIFGIILIKRPGKINKIMGVIIFLFAVLLLFLLFFLSSVRC
jgi:hypothetical protein